MIAMSKQIEVEIFTSRYDKYYKDIVKNIIEVAKECDLDKDKIEIKTLDVAYEGNEEILKKHIKELERKLGVTENPVKAVPLVVINKKPIIVGMNPQFRDIVKKTFEECGRFENRQGTGARS